MANLAKTSRELIYDGRILFKTGHVRLVCISSDCSTFPFCLLQVLRRDDLGDEEGIAASAPHAAAWTARSGRFLGDLGSLRYVQIPRKII